MYRNFLKPCGLQKILERYYCKSNKQVRVRFAPSPTGFMHLGGLRTALLNYLFARKHNGTFILRIEDTDQSRIIDGSLESIQSDLLWAGIISDEDPVRSGPKGPYCQSQRFELYQEQVKVLLENETAYRCFCSSRRLEMIRKEALQARLVPKYDNRCKHLSKEEIQDNLRKNKPFCIRFKLLPTPDPFEDLIMGWKGFDITKSEGDPIIMKSDGYPTYHFANVVDDHFMEISHVLRGVEWQISTPKHLLLYKAFGWEPPKYGHLPLITNSDGTKLSKRQKDITVEYYRKDGILPLALVNYITAAGGGFIRDQIGLRCFTYKELIEQFDIGRINAHSSRLNPDVLLELNRLELHNLLSNEENYKFLIDKVTQIVKQSLPDNENLQLDQDHVISILMWAKTRISRLNDLVGDKLRFLWVKPDFQSQHELKYLEFVDELTKNLENIEENNFSKDTLKTFLKNFPAKHHISFADFMKTLRSLLSGLKEGPSVVEMMEILGKNATLSRLKRGKGDPGIRAISSCK